MTEGFTRGMWIRLVLESMGTGGVADLEHSCVPHIFVIFFSKFRVGAHRAALH